MDCTTPKDIICWLWISFWWKCDKQLCKFKSVLRRHYAKLLWTQATMETIWFVSWWTQILTTAHWEEIYKPWSVHIKLDRWTNPISWITPLERLDWEQWYSVPLRNYIAEFNMDIWDYVVKWNTIELLLPNNVEQWYLVYSRWPQDVRSLSDQFCLNPTEWELLQAWMMRMQAEVNKDYDAAKYWEQREYNIVKSIKEDIEQRIPHTIWMKK